MIITDYPVCEIQVPAVAAVYQRACSSITDPTQRGRWEEQAFVFFPEADTRVMMSFRIDGVEKGMFSTNVLTLTTWKRGVEKPVVKEFRSPEAFCFIRNAKPGCTFNVKGGQTMTVEAK